MSQNSLSLPTSGTLPGLAAVQDVNAALDTLNTLASGASAPSSPEAGQFWHDTGNKLLKLRSMDNTNWITIGTLDETNYLFTAARASALAATLGIAAGGTGATTASGALAALLAGSIIPQANGGTGASSVKSLWTFAASQNGYEVSPSGRIAQWGITGPIGGGGNAGNIAFPLAFPNAALNLVVSTYAGGGTTNGASYQNLSTSGFTAFNNSSNATVQISWHAEGY